jgi:excisionase family DNA binding protein
MTTQPITHIEHWPIDKLVFYARDPRKNDSAVDVSTSIHPQTASNRMCVQEIAGRLNIGRLAVYAMLEQGIMPGIRLGRRWIITRHAYEQWERTCGTRTGAGLGTQPEVTVLN